MLAKIKVTSVKTSENEEVVSFKAIRGEKSRTGYDAENNFSPDKKPIADLSVTITEKKIFGCYKKGDVFALSLTRVNKPLTS